MSPMSGVGWPLLDALGYLSLVTVQVFDVTVERCISVVQKQATVSKKPLRVPLVACHARRTPLTAKAARLAQIIKHTGATHECVTNYQTHGSNSRVWHK
jgi:hypothetical protein